MNVMTDVQDIYSIYKMVGSSKNIYWKYFVIFIMIMILYYYFSIDNRFIFPFLVFVVYVLVDTIMLKNRKSSEETETKNIISRIIDGKVPYKNYHFLGDTRMMELLMLIEKYYIFNPPLYKQLIEDVDDLYICPYEDLDDQKKKVIETLMMFEFTIPNQWLLEHRVNVQQMRSLIE